MKCVIVDDEPLARTGMQMLIEQVRSLELVASFGNAIEAAEFLKNNPVDLLFLDVHMPKLSGIDFLKTTNHSCNVIITTAYPQFAVDAFELAVTDYLVKPIRFERFYKAINRVIDDKKSSSYSEEDYLFIRTERKYIRTHYKEIDYIEGLKDYVIVFCGNEKHIVATNLKTIGADLPAGSFLRINKSIIVNVGKMTAIDHESVFIASKQLAIGEIYKKGIFDFLNTKKILKRP